MSSAAVGSHHHSGAGPLSLMSCVRESSPPQDCDSDNEKNVASKRRFWNPKKWFKRKNKVSDDVVVVEVSETNKEALRSRSTSELSVTDEGRRRSSSSMHPALSVSHDSVFHSPNSGSDIELDAAQSSSSLSICQPHMDTRLQTELNERLRVRRGRGDVSEDDEGFPHSTCNSPTTSDGILLDKTAVKDLPTKSHSTCSDGSLLSMGSYEMDEDSSDPQSRHSSKLSLHEKKAAPESCLELGPCATVAPLNHSAAHHRVSVKPKRTHGVPRRKRGQQQLTALPATPEVNEESSMRSISPEYARQESLTELYSMSATRILTENQIKCSSLPPGLTPPGVDTSKLNRSKSNAGTNSSHHEPFATVQEDAEKEDRPSLFERIFPRKSGRKKKSKDEREMAIAKIQTSEEARPEVTVNAPPSIKSHTETASYTNITSKPIPAPRSGPASRQRIQPIDIPPSPDESRKDAGVGLPKSSPENSPVGMSPLESRLLEHRQISTSTSHPVPIPRQLATPPLSPRTIKPPQSPVLPTVISSKLEYSSHYTKSSSNVAKTSSIVTKSRSEDFRSKMKLPGLSSLQQRVLTLHDETDDGFKSLTDFTPEYVKSSKPLTKSQSFKSRDPIKTSTAEFLSKEQKEQNRISFTKAASLDSVKNLDEKKIHLSEMTFELKRSKQNEPKVETFDNPEIFGDAITISGPSHTAIVNVTANNREDFGSKTHTIERAIVDGSHTISIKEHQVSVTKIQLKQEKTHVTQSTITTASDFWNKQLNKIDTRPTSNIVFSMKSPKVMEEKTRPNTFTFDVTTKPPAPRKFSKENLEIIEKEKEEESASPKTPPIVVSLTQSARYKKNDSKSSSRKSSVISITPESPAKDKNFKSRSSSLDSLKSDSDKSSSQDSLDKLDYPKDKNVVGEPVVLRRKSAVTKNDDEPELMKVFARRSLKIKDTDAQSIQESLDDNKTRDSDKENQSDSSPTEDRKKWNNKTAQETVTDKKIVVKEEADTVDKSPVMLRRTVNNNVFLGQRALSVNPSKSIVTESLVKKQSSFSERRKTDQWMSNMKYEEPELKEKIIQDEIISNISPKGDFITEPKNFSQRKAEWEKRAQLAQKKNTP